jgi:hypothetical protein
VASAAGHQVRLKAAAPFCGTLQNGNPANTGQVEDDLSQPIDNNDVKIKAGERIRTADVQLGKLTFYH